MSAILTVKLFGEFAEAAGCDEFSREMPANSSLGTLWRTLCAEHPGLESAAGSRLSAVNEEYARDEHPLEEGDVVAFFPPVSGG